MSPGRSYILCATPRSGTTLLCDLLTQTGRAGVPQSYFRRQDLEARAKAWGISRPPPGDPAAFDRAYLAGVLRAGTGQGDVFGLRLMWGTLGEVLERLARLYPQTSAPAALLEAAFGPLVYVHVTRADKVAQAISLLRAEQSGLWHVASDGADRQRVGPPAPERYDHDRLAELVAELERDDAAWTAFFADHGIAPVEVNYEVLAIRPDDPLRKILTALGQPPALAHAAAPQTRRMADQTSVEWADRFRQERSR